jgi:hypothetical protein
MIFLLILAKLKINYDLLTFLMFIINAKKFKYYYVHFTKYIYYKLTLIKSFSNFFMKILFFYENIIFFDR